MTQAERCIEFYNEEEFHKEICSTATIAQDEVRRKGIIRREERLYEICKDCGDRVIFTRGSYYK